MPRKKTQYTLRSGGDVYHGIPAQMLGEALERIRRKHGGKLRASDVWDEARSKDSILHSVCTWNEKKAAKGYQLWQIRECIKVVTVIDAGETEPYVVHVPIREAGAGYWKPPGELALNVDEFEAALAQAKTKLIAAQRAFDAIRKQAGQLPEGDNAAKIALVIEALGTARQISERIH